MNPDSIYTPMASLYVGDLPTDVTEAMLFEKFSTAGPVLSVRVCSGHAYVNFLHPADARRALDEMNFDEIKGRQMRIMWLQPDSSLRKSGVGNVFIKNLHPTISNEMLFDTLSAFGNILSCKIVQDENGTSKGFGYVQFETEEEANLTIKEVNGMLLANQKVYVGRFIPREEREKTLGKNTKLYTNVYINNFGVHLTDEQFFHIFKHYGTITSHKIMRTDDGKSKGFGFVQFENPEAAETAIEALNGCPVSVCNEYLDPKLQICTDGKDLAEGKPLYVGLAQKKAERQQVVKRHFEELKIELFNRSQGASLYANNFGKALTEEQFLKIFQHFGTITSHKIMRTDDGKSRGFGFVQFDTPEAAETAIKALNGCPASVCNEYLDPKLQICTDSKNLAEGKPLYVGFAQKKAERQQEMMDRSLGLNLYVKNLDDSIQDCKLIQEFSPFGTITSAKVMMEEGRSKGFGFVCFSAPEEATKAMTEMNGRIVGSKPLYVALAQKKEDRKAHLTSQYMQKMANMQMPQMGQFNQPGTSSGNFIPTIPAPQRFYGATQFRTNPRRPVQAPVRPGAQSSAIPNGRIPRTHRPAPRRRSNQDSVMRRNVSVPSPMSGASTMSELAPGG